MSDDLIISNEQEPEELPEEVIFESTTVIEYIQAAYFALSSVVDMDDMVMSREDAKRVRRIKRKSLAIIDNCIIDLYNELFDKDEEDE